MCKLRELYPAIEPYNHGYLQVSGGHDIYFEQCGNPQGSPVLYVHGGPGAGCDADDRRFFNPEKYRVILFDQRGCGRSKPFGETSFNTTQHLVSDMELLMREFRVERAKVFGGSWGSTLAAVFAIKHPEMVTHLILRGIFLGNEEEVRNSYITGSVVSLIYPELWERYLSHVPEERRDDPPAHYTEMMGSPDPLIRTFYAYEWARFENALLHLKPQSDAELDEEMRQEPFEALSLLELHYMRNGCFMEDDYIIKNADKIKHNIPTHIVQGRYDIVCPPKSAYRLWLALDKKPEIHWVLAGHSKSDPETQSKLIEIVDSLD